MKVCFVDASSAILLYKAGMVEIFFDMYQVVVAAAVQDELLRDGYAGARLFEYAIQSQLVTVLLPPSGRLGRAYAVLDRGERDTVACYLAAPANGFIMTDDGTAARLCRHHALPFVNALLFVRLAVMVGRLPEREGEAKLAQLAGLGRYANWVVSFAGQCPEAELVAFLP